MKTPKANTNAATQPSGVEKYFSESSFAKAQEGEDRCSIHSTGRTSSTSFNAAAHLLQLRFLHARTQHAFRTRMTRVREELEKLCLTEKRLRWRLTTLQLAEVEQGTGLPWVLDTLQSQATMLARLNDMLSRAGIPYEKLTETIDRGSSLLPLHPTLSIRDLDEQSMVSNMKDIALTVRLSMDNHEEIRLIKETATWLRKIHHTVAFVQRAIREIQNLTITLVSLSEVSLAHMAARIPFAITDPDGSLP
ncbi:hypothetical protein BJ684DRAFT_19472 [Piptocephalis cylindrospora]|uniref:Uncharacterized protein n=1 Tax=Piptocephalis cylindrospora TaxID=1907219 RepID=A0A4P9Y580_9FUNG|nr:hypothetical protein BJ684DRAFT_19472 [Piptocephalis cylindrospora]|eukprot:RKP14095.1 hypothetical protein BJ684DRAFT_19472 [Piptocephalis cylindrospora]